MKKIFGKTILAAAMSLLCLTNCSNDDNVVPQQEPVYDMSGFAKGADVSWLTEMESSDTKFYDATGRERECMSLLRDLGANAIRLRVWVNPADGWCNKQDVLAKAWRARNLGFRLMIDFHYSDTWADPGQQTPPDAWKDYDLEQMKQAVSEHTTDVLQALKERGIDVEWVQVGNETRTGMLWETGRVSGSDFAGFTALLNAGYDAAKAVYPDAKVIVHIDKGETLSNFTWMFDGLQENGGKWDVIGMSLYPEDDTWETQTDDCLANISELIARYGKPVMICEIGMPWDSEHAAAAVAKVVDGCKAIENCLGVFYWEPQCYNSWEGYTKGAFDNEGRPTSVLDAFKR